MVRGFIPICSKHWDKKAMYPQAVCALLWLFCTTGLLHWAPPLQQRWPTSLSLAISMSRCGICLEPNHPKHFLPAQARSVAVFVQDTWLSSGMQYDWFYIADFWALFISLHHFSNVCVLCYGIWHVALYKIRLEYPWAVSCRKSPHCLFLLSNQRYV